MRERIHYGKAPITQALIDIQVQCDPLTDLAVLAAPPPEIAADYPGMRPVFDGRATISLNPGDDPKFETKQIGYSRIGTADHRYVLQARLEGLTVSRIEPYTRWENLRDEFMRIWKWYQATVKPHAVTRLAVRYTNRLDLPLPFSNFNEYLCTRPEIGASLPPTVSGFIMQLQIPMPELPGMAVLNEAIIPPVRDDTVAVLLDIDVAQSDKLSTDFSDQLELLHEKEYALFEGSITDKTRGLIK